ncbi:MAG: 16S rRNA (cytidine(1402)-2'-O)-methyltransferase [Candidatus Nealsonbacteria bacterium]|nr:16S rRNA (cytidine(1402)-2'-O)-methyltransferase [Candidatus Nealsonbacteria bacterium]
MANLYVVATPIGNLGDITFRAIETLKSVDLILCEDTRITQKLLSHYGIKTPTLSYHQHSKLNKVEFILDILRRGKDLALVSDAGTPGVSDPGNKLVEKVVELLGNSVNIEPIPGPSAVTASASISGFPVDRFLFLGFPPIKNKRKKFFEEVAASKYSVIFYESPYRILKTLKELISLIKGRDIVVCRELTKKFETIYRGNIEEVAKKIETGKIKGEFAVIVEK